LELTLMCGDRSRMLDHGKERTFPDGPPGLQFVIPEGCPVPVYHPIVSSTTGRMSVGALLPDWDALPLDHRLTSLRPVSATPVARGRRISGLHPH
jgi:hypothetical protein